MAAPGDQVSGQGLSNPLEGLRYLAGEQFAFVKAIGEQQRQDELGPQRGPQHLPPPVRHQPGPDQAAEDGVGGGHGQAGERGGRAFV